MLANANSVASALKISHSLPIDGRAAHGTVPPECWCVTQFDLKQLRIMVKVAVREGQITPVDLDPFDPDDNVIGPCIHTVTQQFVKPITARAGDCSWALMCHPVGCKCDLFISHCWQEGIYEFIDKVLLSWPYGCQYAYCCMFSNPQNFSIADLISSPLHSPFAKALNSATYVLVVPNTKTSIYTRIWCVYEVFLAYSHNKFIFTASAPIPGFWFTLALVAIVGLLGLCAGRFLLGVFTLVFSVDKSEILDSTFLVGHVVYTVCVLFSAFSGPFWYTRLSNYLGIATVGIVTYNASVFYHDLGFLVEFKWKLQYIFYLVFFFITALFFIAAEADRMVGVRAHIEAGQLTHDYTGQLRNAQSSSVDDKDAILAEIAASGCEAEVNKAVEMLISAGISTPCLRQAEQFGVDVSFVGRGRLSVTLLGWGHWLFAPPPVMFQRTGVQRVMLGLTMFQGVVWSVTWLWLPIDKKNFANLAVAKVFFIGHFIPGLLDNFLTPELSTLNIFLDALFVSPLTLLLSVLGPGMTAQIPLVGPCLAQYVIGNFFRTFFGRCCQRRTPCHMQRPCDSEEVQFAAMS